MASTSAVHSPFAHLSAFDAQSGDVNVVIETPKGSRNKFAYDEEHGLFKLRSVLPAGAVFPFDFGFVPSTVGGDGDPLDVLVLMDEPAFVGCLVPARLIGAIEADQTEENGTTRNDRLIAVAADAHQHRTVRSLDDISTSLMDEIEHFFISYNAIKGQQFRPAARSDPGRAKQLVEEAVERRRRPETSSDAARR